MALNPLNQNPSLVLPFYNENTTTVCPSEFWSATLTIHHADSLKLRKISVKIHTDPQEYAVSNDQGLYIMLWNAETVLFIFQIFTYLHTYVGSLWAHCKHTFSSTKIQRFTFYYYYYYSKSLKSRLYKTSSIRVMIKLPVAESLSSS